MKQTLATLVLCIAMVGCAATDLIGQAETPDQRYYAALIVFDEYDQAALDIAQSPDTPESVREGLKSARAVARAALDVADEAYAVYAAARAQLEATPDQTALDELTAALGALNARLDTAVSAVRAFSDTVGEQL